MESTAYEAKCFVVDLYPNFSWEDLLVYSEAAFVLTKWMRSIDAIDPLNEILHGILNSFGKLLQSLQSSSINAARDMVETWQFHAGDQVRVATTYPFAGLHFLEMLLRVIPQSIGNLYLHIADGNAPLPDMEKANALAELMNFHIWLQNARDGTVGPLTPMKELHREDFPRQGSG